MGTFLGPSIANLGAVIIKTPSEDKLEVTVSGLQPCGSVYFLIKRLETCFVPSSAFSS